MADGPCWDDVLGTKPEETLAVRRAAFNQLLSGQPASIEAVADEAGLAQGQAQEAANLVASVGIAEVDDGIIIGMDGLTTRPTRHGLVLNGVQLWTWCAYDIVGIAAALGVEAVGDTTCGACGERIKIVIRAGSRKSRAQWGGCPTSPARTSWRSSVRAHCCSAPRRTSTSGRRGKASVPARRWTSNRSLIVGGASGDRSFRERSGGL
jgi:Alkylmercury lyase